MEPLAQLLARPPLPTADSHPQPRTQPHSQQQQQQAEVQQTVQSPTKASGAESIFAPAAGDTADQKAELPETLSALHLQCSSDGPALESSQSAGVSGQPDGGVTLDPLDTQQLEGALQLEVMYALLLLLQPPEVLWTNSCFPQDNLFFIRAL